MSALLVLGLWWLSLQQRATALRQTREVALQANLRDLSASFAALDNLPVVLLRSLQLDSGRLAELSARARPFGRLELNRPEWAREMAEARFDLAEHGLVVLRPLPPGYEQKPVSEQAPLQYLVYCLRTADGQWLIFNVDLDYVYQRWLPEHLDRFGLSGLKWELVQDAGEPTLLAEQRPPFPQHLLVELDDGPLLQENLQLHLAGLALALLVLAGFAAGLRLAAQGVVRELEFTEARSRFMAMASHELRTPIATIKMYSEILQNDLQADRQAQYHQVIARQARRLQHLVENLLEAGALERGQRSFTPQLLDLNQLVEEAVAYAEGVTVDLNLAADLPPVRADRSASLQVLANLLDNAHKYAGRAQIVTSPGRIEVCDNGPGIADKTGIFEPYRRESGQCGFGLGLSVVRNLMIGQGGQVKLYDQPGGGARFVLEFPT